jgi:hypothetical protein
MRHCGKRQTCWFGIRLMRPSGATCLLLFQWTTTCSSSLSIETSLDNPFLLYSCHLYFPIHAKTKLTCYIICCLRTAFNAEWPFCSNLTSISIKHQYSYLILTVLFLCYSYWRLRMRVNQWKVIIAWNLKRSLFFFTFSISQWNPALVILRWRYCI